MARSFRVQTGRGRDAGDGHNDNGRRDTVVEAALHVEGLADSTRHPPVRHDRGAEGRVGRSQGSAQK